MDFFARQESARRRTWWLVVLFFAAIAGLIVSAYLAVMTVTGVAVQPTDGIQPLAPAPMWDPGIFAAISAAISLIVFGGTSYKLSQLSKGGTVVADMMGGRRLNPASTQFHERRLLNVVEEMALASGVPVPPVYVMPGQMGINAFAAGYSMNDAVVGITEGAMRGLKREELQGVVAHEFSHILNGDMRMNIRLIGIVHGLLVLALVGRILLQFSGRARGGGDKKGGAAVVVLAAGLAMLVIGYAGYFFGGLIKRAVSRQREYLADASAVQFTRNPMGLANALKKVGGLAQAGVIKNNHTEELSHMFFADGIKRMFGAGSWFATHPPLEKRVKLLDPSFSGEFTALTEDSLAFSGLDSEVPPAAPSAAESKKKKTDGKGADFIQRTVMAGGSIAHSPQDILQQVGVLDQLGMEASATILAGLPAELQAMAHDAISAQAVILALVLRTSDQDSSPFAWTWLPAYLSVSVNRAADLLKDAGPQHRLPLVEIALPALREMSKEQALRFMETLEEIIKADNKVDLFEFSVREIIRSGLRETIGEPVTRISITSVSEVTDSVVTVLSLLAHSGTDQQAVAEKAFQAGLGELGIPAGTKSLTPNDLLSMDQASAALQHLLTASMPVRGKILAAALVCLQNDRTITVAEAELFRTLATVLEVPVPPDAFAKKPAAT